jgi:hypothetical protein
MSFDGTQCTGVRVAGSMGMLTGSGNSQSWTNLTVEANGRVTASNQKTNAGGILHSYPFTYTYFADDSLASVTYPSGKAVATCYDGNGRISWVSSVRTVDNCKNGTGTGQPVYASVTAWWPHGAAKITTYGNGLIESSKYNTRLQPTELALNSGALWKVRYEYGTTNNGNVLKQKIDAPGMITITQAYTYDGANRLAVAAEYSVDKTTPSCADGTSVWCQHFGYDAYGNRTITARTNLARLCRRQRTPKRTINLSCVLPCGATPVGTSGVLAKLSRRLTQPHRLLRPTLRSGTQHTRQRPHFMLAGGRHRWHDSELSPNPGAWTPAEETSPARRRSAWP